jgi:pyrimidine-specific ribonucleoside hydrolase
MTKKRFIFTLFLFLIFIPCLNAHTYKVPLLVDTDMALDDMRTLVMLLNSDMADIRLIVSSDGAASPRAGADNIKRLLKYFERQDTDVGIGRALDKPAPPWRSWSENPGWLGPIPTSGFSALPAVQAVLKTLNTTDCEVVYLCLGPLTNLADALRSDPGIKKKISRVIFFGGLPGDPDPGWNYTRDPESAEFAYKSGVNIYSLYIHEKKLLPFDQKLTDRIRRIDTPAARMVTALHKTPTISRLLSEGHFRVWDEMTAIFINSPSLFRFGPTEISDVMRLTDFQADKIQDAYVKLIGHGADFHLDVRKAVVLNDFPSDPLLFREDLRPHVEEIIRKYGFEEWKACILTNEFHRHLGIYSIIGAKMGIRAREILEAPFDTLEVLSFAGNRPPLSCMNDGLQVSTGASLGRGTIRLSEGKPRPAVAFVHKNRKISLIIKEEIVEKIKSDIQSALKKYGGLNPEYFTHIRELSIRYWHDLDRKKIFDEIRAHDQGGALDWTKPTDK